jgi:hypothetical protein
MIGLIFLIGSIVALLVSAVVIFIFRLKIIGKADKEDQFNWWLPFFAVVGALILFIPLMIYGVDIDEMLYIFISVPNICIIIIVVAMLKKGLHRKAVLSMLVVYIAVSWGLFKNSNELRWTTRWLLWSKDYKAKVLAQPNPANGELRHVEWDGWGWGGNDTVVYLVFDPSDSLSAAAKNYSSGKFSGIPCEAYRVRRMESHYYTALFYTDTGWNSCN